MMSTFRLTPIALALVATPLLLEAQGRARPAAEPRTPPDLPAEMMPPAGKCRIWMEGVAPAQQPAPTDCQTAIRQRPTNGVVVFGPTAKEPPVQGFRSQPRPARDDTARATPARNTARPTATQRERPEARRDSTPAGPRRPDPDVPERPF